MIRHLQGIPIEIGPLANSALPELLSLYADRRIVIMVDENTHANCLDMLLNEFKLKLKRIRKGGVYRRGAEGVEGWLLKTGGLR